MFIMELNLNYFIRKFIIIYVNVFFKILKTFNYIFLILITFEINMDYFMLIIFKNDE